MGTRRFGVARRSDRGVTTTEVTLAVALVLLVTACAWGAYLKYTGNTSLSPKPDAQSAAGDEATPAKPPIYREPNGRNGILLTSLSTDRRCGTAPMVAGLAGHGVTPTGHGWPSTPL